MSGVTVPTTIEIDLLQVDWMRLLQILHRFDRQVARGDSLVHQMTLANPGAFQNPLVGGVHHCFKVLVGQNARRDVSSKSSNFGATSCRQ